ncbi:MAG: SPOR domain-containing protein [Acidobacteriales bacterium]|nr:SPOR domain-containing protein [Terriglobales bacterium]
MRDSDDEIESSDITLGTGKLLGLFLGLVVICGIFFSLGYAMGKNSGSIPTQLTETPATLSPGTTPTQKPGAGTAAEVVPSQMPTEPLATGEQPAADTSTTPVSQPAEAQPQPQQPTPKLETTSAKMAVVGENTAALVVQIAAVSKREDAEILISALKHKNYPAFVANTTDNLFHVQVGPYTDVTAAKTMRDKLASDGYSPILKRQ